MGCGSAARIVILGREAVYERFWSGWTGGDCNRIQRQCAEGGLSMDMTATGVSSMKMEEEKRGTGTDERLMRCWPSKAGLALVSIRIVGEGTEMTGHACTMGEVQPGFIVGVTVYGSTPSRLGNIILLQYHIQDDLCWWSHVGGFQKAERRTDDEVELVPLKKR